MTGLIISMILQISTLIGQPKEINTSITQTVAIVEQVTPTKENHKKVFNDIKNNTVIEKTENEKEEKENLCLYCGKDKGKNTSLCNHCLINNEFTELPKMETEEEEQAFYDWHYFNEETKKWELM